MANDTAGASAYGGRAWAGHSEHKGSDGVGVQASQEIERLG
jgi:hypothetical protein